MVKLIMFSKHNIKPIIQLTAVVFLTAVSAVLSYPTYEFLIRHGYRALAEAIAGIYAISFLYLISKINLVDRFFSE